MTEQEKYFVIRPIFGEYNLDKNDFPIIKKESVSFDEINNLKIVNYQNRNNKKLKSTNKSLLTMFCYDDILNRIWNNPLKDIVSFQKFKFITTPDFSIYPKMNSNDIKHNVYMNRWLGVTYQTLGLKVFPTIQWGDESTYGYCFSAVEKESIVVISTLGCKKDINTFLNGFNEMKKIIEPKIIIVYGDMIKGMSGKFINFKYEEAFIKKNQNEQISLWNNNGIFEISEKGEIKWEAEELLLT